MQIADLIKIIKVQIPETDFIIELKTQLSWFEQLEYIKIENDIEQGKFMFEKLIIKWNLKGEEGNPIPISRESIEQLPANVMLYLGKKIKEISEERIRKKKFWRRSWLSSSAESPARSPKNTRDISSQRNSDGHTKN